MNTTNNLPRDGSTAPIQEANNFSTVDGNISSPINLGGDIMAIPIPSNAAEFIVYPVSNDLNVSEFEDMSSSDLVSKGNKEPFPCAGMDTIYIQGQFEDMVYFRFHEV